MMTPALMVVTLLLRRVLITAAVMTMAAMVMTLLLRRVLITATVAAMTLAGDFGVALLTGLMIILFSR